MSRTSRTLPFFLFALSISACTLTADMGTGIPPSELERGKRPVDFLIVLDNSGSMCEEQERLIESFFDQDCPIQDVSAVPEQFMISLSSDGSSSDTFEELSSTCGLAQLLAAYDNDFRVGVITTDVGMCDNRYGLAAMGEDFGSPIVCRTEPDWGRRPQRGCLQAPDAWERKYLTRDDADIELRFRHMVESVGVFGSPFERGLDAVEVFVSETEEKAPGCEEDAAGFLREEARLAVVFLTDEDDCSHADGLFGLPDENAGGSCALEMETLLLDSSAADCYARRDELAPVDRYARLLRGLKRDPRDVSVMVLAGASGGRTSAEAEGCIAQPGGEPLTACWNSGGSSNFTGPGALCSAEGLAERGIDEPCCEADAAPRYATLVDELGGTMAVAESICRDEFSDAMSRFARVLGEPWLVEQEAE